MILLIDNYDSFVHNLARYVGELGFERTVLRNDAITVEAAIASKPDAIILSPGPCGPGEAGISVALAKAAAEKRIPLLGVCLGHQAIAAAFGGTIRRAAPVHGKPAEIHHDGSGIFRALPNPFTAARYHSLVADLDPAGPLRATAHIADGTLMALAHEDAPLFGVQFHPESVLTEHGHLLLSNFLTQDTRMRKSA
ncbi:aminodeoxychorismate/anthranilate synthase component II [Parvibaculum sp.]|uniref:anthranilate synthase component II n=1 Tax=Parvibaculum sp. TaxID=2024848 RepID=UPI002CEB8B82|nr:aminodeoxychorismate/anthranilate synthase component II [Parvibaculum sp.]HUD52357.1 aminodeoxychorismate/anthranilate synthase component II [Parvibaculum sp.]